MQDLTARWVPTRLRLWAADLLLMIALFVLVLRMEPRPVDGWLLVQAVFAAAVTLRRRRYPERVLALTTVVTVIGIFAKAPAGGLFITLGVLTYSAALYGTHRRPWIYATLVWTALITAGSLAYFAQWWEPSQFGLFAFIFGGAGAGDSVRMRRAYIAEVTERARQAELTRDQEARRRVMDERLRIARELHDVVAHHIAVISVHAGAADHVLRNQPEKVWPVLAHIRTAADTVLEEIKSVVGVLRDPNELASTEPTPGLDRLPDLLDSLRAMDFPVRFQEHGTSRPLPAMVDLAAYRIAQEALTNAHKYGEGAALLDVTYTEEAVSVEVTNRVAWPRGRRPGSGFGVLGMRERAAAAQGTITAGPTAGGWFRVYAVLPAHAPALHEGAPA
ncbi:sensor histidine kinase [Actinoplanes palleronii]|uniref:histidine kinase n=1 Tax=Actinoplanes palleronii TaxID=113570 RepID=A0ABQ4BPQ2_9ACTN|nr:histidine kinase [Actinoplanes palleronii]GIE72266.1 two-component sensor histidine kinase [Actinoplanes palleronii]